ncbi:hypothetical protein HII17_12100 [Thalassotalea sp. M1531]|uniref:Lipoprotein n=1 Tax=Thalassotalea algicola TaxID=2716224 RepID=A0A7Y0LD90_9GAMM|nr:DUF6279 family lipoprotein [Thalassotalea algicola]NMP32306.1 hypothetical protein [Thalassotalea algicola]
MLKNLKLVKRWGIITTSLLLLSGCSFSFVYNNLDWWANWYLDDYVILNDEQQKSFDEAFDKIHIWHRKTQLKVYYTQLLTLKEQVNTGITIDQLASHIGQVNSHWVTVRDQTKSDLISLTHTLTKEQRENLVDSIRESNKERVEEREILTREQWVKEECIDQQKQFRKWVGKLNKTQKKTICQYTEGFVSTFDYWIEYRTNWLNQFSQALSPELTKEKYELLFAELIVQPEKLRSEDYIAIREQNNQVATEIFFYMMNNLSKKQLNRFNNRIDDFIEDLQDLEIDS